VVDPSLDPDFGSGSGSGSGSASLWWLVVFFYFDCETVFVVDLTLGVFVSVGAKVR